MSNITQTDSMRLFLGFSLNKPTQCHFIDIQHKLTDYINTESIQVNPVNFHVTLGFLGSIGQSVVPLLIDCITKMKKSQFELSLSELQFWQKPKIICMTGHAQPNLITMAETVQNIAQQLKLHQSQYPYQPHVTLFRKANRLNLEHNVDVLHNMLPISLSPIELHLYRSINTGKGVEYQIIHSWSLD